MTGKKKCKVCGKPCNRIMCRLCFIRMCSRDKAISRWRKKKGNKILKIDPKREAYFVGKCNKCKQGMYIGNSTFKAGQGAVHEKCPKKKKPSKNKA